ncbi:hypothetical protein KO525_07450 [Psychrosphaera sp. B3R10]|uniref:Wzz/FepE/Etk N-terminal domain-containing protein n=1 Tax=unclassified Psychrosphaera TaxID=2641570 RepID=UPI001C0A3F9B|nr:MULTISPECIES: Wzz/FepE/Etk N-terminal domain-containing protein [unclassified Psychrosphaera]MBU2881824.1 hypothetical protein [Psychrosphaera sp. I2R16]MBU2989204.1 hypothetical protein [Psychrosphaera sp. B3R10]MDO6719980.1 Wzz/FepE/Etk N-terminal domain-containing protein [Psychrosphaera sp. 1_MG-2023]
MNKNKDIEDKVVALEHKLNKVSESTERFSETLNYQQGLYNGVDSEIDFKEVLRVIIGEYKKILIVTFIFGVVSAIYALSLPNIYSSTVRMIPAQQESEGGLSSLASKYGGLAAMAGVNLGTSGSSDSIQHAVELMNSWSYLESIILKYDLKAKFMAVEGWDGKSDTLEYNSDIYSKELGEWLQLKSFFGSKLRTSEPSSYDTYLKFKKDFFGVNFDAEKGIFEITVKHFSPKVAFEVTNIFSKEINEYFRSEDKKQALASVDFIEDKIKTTSNTQMLEVFYNMIESHTQKIMLTEISEEYLLRTLIPAKIAETKYKVAPKRSVIVLISILFAGIATILWVLISHFYNKKD